MKTPEAIAQECAERLYPPPDEHDNHWVKLSRKLKVRSGTTIIAAAIREATEQMKQACLDGHKAVNAAHRKEVARLQMELDATVCAEQHRQVVAERDQLRAEVEGLKAEFANEEEAANDLPAERDRLEGIIEKLCEAVGFTPEWTSRYGYREAIEQADVTVRELRTKVERLEEVASWAQAVLTALNTGDIASGSPLHLKLREVMIEYRIEHAAREKGTT